MVIAIEKNAPAPGYAAIPQGTLGPATITTVGGSVFELDVHHVPGLMDITFFVGAAEGLSAFSISRVAIKGGTPVLWLSGTDFGTPSTLNPATLTESGAAWAIPIPASTIFTVVLDVRGTDALIISATAETANTTLDLESSWFSSNTVNM